MDDSDLDTLLARARPDAPPDLGHELHDLEVGVARRHRRARWAGTGAVLAGVAALTGAGLYVAPGMEAWPWSTLEPGATRLADQATHARR